MKKLTAFFATALFAFLLFSYTSSFAANCPGFDMVDANGKCFCMFNPEGVDACTCCDVDTEY